MDSKGEEIYVCVPANNCYEIVIICVVSSRESVRCKLRKAIKKRVAFNKSREIMEQWKEENLLCECMKLKTKYNGQQKKKTFTLGVGNGVGKWSLTAWYLQENKIANMFTKASASV